MKDDNGAPRFARRSALVLLFVLHPSSFIRSEPPTFFEPKDGYYQARGVRVLAVWAVDRTELPEDGELLATLTVRGATNPHEIVRPDLRKLKPFADSFRSIQDVPAPAAARDASEVSFAYRLRPRDRAVNRLPSLDFFYLNPAIVNKNPFENARARGIDLTVTAPAPKPPPPPLPMYEPDHLFAVATGVQVSERESFRPGVWSWIAAFALGPIAAIGWFIVWRIAYPDAARLARLRRSRAARRALDAIRRAGRSADPAGAIAGAVLGYLRSRFVLPIGAETPSEIEAALTVERVPIAADAAAFFRKADAVRFAQLSDTPVSFADDAASLIGRLEAVE